MTPAYIFNYHQWAYAAFTGKRPNTKTAGASIVAAYNAKIRLIKDAGHYENRDIKALILFCFLHDPLKLENIEKYGKVENIAASLSHFINWRRTRKREIIDKGLIATIMATVPVQSKLNKELEKEIEEAFTI